MLGRRDNRQRRRRLAAVGATGVAVKRHHDAKVAAEQEASPEPAGQTQTAAASAGGLSEDSMTRLKELGELHEQNVLSDEEFEQEKAKLLDSK